MKINAKNITAKNVQIGKTNVMNVKDFVNKHDEELLRLINLHSPTEVEKQALISDLRAISEESEDSKSSAKKLLDFVKDVASNVSAGAIVLWLERFVKE